jgi:hypothetical protein
LSKEEGAKHFSGPVLNVLLRCLNERSLPAHYAVADVPPLWNSLWIEEQCDVVRRLANASVKKKGMLMLNKVQKIPGWPEVNKKLCDKDGP